MSQYIPLQVIFGNPERISPRISPNGQQLAWIAPHDNVLNLWLAPIIPRHGVEWAKAKVVTDDTDRGIRTFVWARNGRHLLYLQDTAGDENWRLYDVDLRTMERRDLTPFADVQAQLIALSRDVPDQVLVGLNMDNKALHDVYRLDLTTGELSKEATNPGFIGWVADCQLRVRAGYAPDATGGLDVQVRDVQGGSWRSLMVVPADDMVTSEAICFSQDANFLLATSSVGAETGRLVRINVATGAVDVLAEDPHADVSNVQVHPHTREPRIVTLLKDRSDYRVLDSSVAADLEAIRKLNGGDPVVIDTDDADANWIVSFTNDSEPVSYFSYRRDRREGTFLFERQPALSQYQLAPMKPFSFLARDGLMIHAYATFPADSTQSNLPAVVNVHGGPWARDTWGFSAQAQWLANRGYLCLQVNFRGSTGYGKAFVNAGDREWGGSMQDDLTDAVAYAVGQGWADPTRVAIYGTSYGGYAALAGAAFTPELYRCAVDVVGPSNLNTLIEAIPPYWAPLRATFHRRVGNPEVDQEFLWSRSPISRVKDIRIPLLIAHGANDPRVKRTESEQIVAALKEAEIEHAYLLFPDEGHGLDKPDNRLRFYAAAEAFLARHLGPTTGG